MRTFYARLKEGTQTGALARMFVTGVMPLMLDDLSSGFNIARHASLSPRLNTLAGFTRGDIERAVDGFLDARTELKQVSKLGDRRTLLDMMEEHYNGYRFAEGARERVFNAALVLYFLHQIVRFGDYPVHMLDMNARTEYEHIERLGALSGTSLSERRALLETIASEGHIRSEIVERFGVRSLAPRTDFLSLLYYLGMLTLGASPRSVEGYHLEIPNRVIRELQWEHLALLLKDEAHVAITPEERRTTLGAMAVKVAKKAAGKKRRAG